MKRFWFVILMLLAGVAGAQDPQGLGTSDLVAQAEQMLAGDAYDAVIPYLNEIIARLKDLDNPKAKETLGFARYRLGEAYFMVKRYDDARPLFEQYIREMPDGDSIIPANFYLAEILAIGKSWAQVEQQILALRGKTMDMEQRLIYNQFLGQACYQQKEWSDSLEPLLYVAENSEREKVRNGAAVMVVTALIRADRFDDLFKYLPMVYSTSAKYDVGLNVALMEGGAEKYKAEKYFESLMMYRLVYLKEELVARLQEQIDRLAAEANAKYDRTTGFTLPQYQKRKAESQSELEELKAQMEQLRALPEYDQEISARIAQTYQQMNRFWEAYLIFRNLHELFPGTDIADQGLYSSFSVLVQMELYDRAETKGLDYIKTYPHGNFRDVAVLNMMRMYMQQGNVEKALEMYDLGLGGRPEPESVAEWHYLAGFCRFQQQDFEKAFDRFTAVTVLREGAESYIEPAEYWQGMCKLFLGKYEESAQYLGAFVGKYPMGSFTEDAYYRWGISKFGAGEIEAAAKIFADFLERWSLSKLRSEALSMQADIRAADGRLDLAEKDYREAIDCAENMDQRDYAVFQYARMLEMEDRNEEIATLMRDYLDQWGEQGNFSEAAYWLGSAQKRMGDLKGALAVYLEAVEDYGNMPDRYGVDKIIDEIVNESSVVFKKEERQILDAFRAELDEARIAAVESEKRTLALRLQTLIAALSDADEARRIEDELASAENVDEAAPSTLAFMARAAIRLQDYALSDLIYKAFSEKHAESDLIMDAMHAEAQALMARKDYDAAFALCQEALDRFGFAGGMGWAQKGKADIFRLRGDYGKAADEYKQIFAVKDWRGPLSAESLYWMGICLLEQGEQEKATAFFERVYIMYEGYTEWAVKAGIKRAETLEQMGEKRKAYEVYSYLNGREQLTGVPGIAAAAEGMRRLSAYAGTQTDGGVK